MEIKVIKNDKDYKEALVFVEGLIDEGVEKDSDESEKLDVLITLIQDYESKMFPETIPDPIDALEFIMEQRSLSQEDLVPYIGSRSKVSEVLSRKRPLSLNMIKTLHAGLGIPAKILISQKSVNIDPIEGYEKFPIKEMIKRGYLGIVDSKNFNLLKKKIDNFFSIIDSSNGVLALLSRTYYVRSPKTMNTHYLFAWATQVIHKAREVEDVDAFVPGKVNQKLMKKIIDLSDESDGISKAIELLKKNGVIVIVERHLPYTYLDGAAIIIKNLNPIIGLTIRHDRLDNFWFTLIHELAHIILHRDTGISLFYDDTESVDRSDSRELEADRLAIETMIPEKSWNKSPASILPSVEEAKKLAKELGVHPAIVAGRMRYQNQYFSHLNDLVGQGEVRHIFPNINWKV